MVSGARLVGGCAAEPAAGCGPRTCEMSATLNICLPSSVFWLSMIEGRSTSLAE